MYQLKNNRLKIEVQEPGNLYQGSRFDWTGFVTQITLDDCISYCVPERLEHGKGTGGLGFCNEFGIDLPLGYDTTATGDFFPKIGVGLLKKKVDTPYDFFNPYDVSPATVEVEQHPESLTFETAIKNAHGYGYHLFKALSLKDNKLVFEYRLINTGSHTIKTNEYSHNFIGINNQTVSEDYQLTFPGLRSFDLSVGKMSQSHEQLTWPVTPDGDFYAKIVSDNEPASFIWDLFHRRVGAGVRASSDFRPTKIALWGRSHVICPEVFFDIHLQPNEEISWQRVYEFYQTNA
ncbi:hypothetical protein DES38_1028 [Streptohalobacillus salinus]|uniref:Galactose mutarotase-like enzyme n=1 Tax=Streptohalobacillus salinus TaxID=621096 RepID=A0A2V3WCI2_9BACI|nr:hypothetical protein [Streptohalobacillus salinus]PXW92430.1 hypothetical protein DES38_1028 [Streptohalobacillus salinus]